MTFLKSLTVCTLADRERSDVNLIVLTQTLDVRPSLHGMMCLTLAISELLAQFKHNCLDGITTHVSSAVRRKIGFPLRRISACQIHRRAATLQARDFGDLGGL
ncbi:hypothetical protein JTB14_013779 [Gonioctena quinquepunctata]|nr:hypothetical protein JTB14_013779 [Gonioctena quinquepunctata]